MMTNVMMKTCLNQKIIKISNLIQAVKNSVCPKAKVMWRRNLSQSRICPNIYRMFRSVDWTHDMIIVKWHLFIWYGRKLCALTNAPPVQSTRMGQWLSTLFHANCFFCSGLCLVPSAIHLRSELQATTILAGITIHWALRRIFWKIFCVYDDDKCYDENMS